jgi:SAM-dependent methyltransferase
VGKSGSKARGERRGTMAARADLHRLYERAVHDAEAEIDFIRDTYRRLRGRHAQSFREDFSGPSSSACEWVRRGPRCRAIGVDLEPAVLEWSRSHRVSRLTPGQRRRLRLVEGNVLTVRTPAVDVIAALNFSYWVFKDRRTLLRYFRAARDALKRDGLLVLDAFGGHEASKEMRERTKLRGFTYVWHQAAFRPVTSEILCHIHFTFPDGSRIDRAFSYDWRLWTLPEIRELLAEAGFNRSTVYWEGDDGEGGGNGEFTPTEHGESDAGWVAYVVAER